MYVCMYVCMHECMCLCVYLCIYAFMHLCIYACMAVGAARNVSVCFLYVWSFFLLSTSTKQLLSGLCLYVCFTTSCNWEHISSLYMQVTMTNCASNGGWMFWPHVFLWGYYHPESWILSSADAHQSLMLRSV